MIQPIYSDEAEKAVLGSVLINQEIFKTLDLQAEDFYLSKHKIIWTAFQDIYMDGGVIDILTLAEKLRSGKQLKETGGEIYITELVTRVPSSVYAEQYANIVREKARRRELVQLAGEIASSAYDENSDLENVIPAYMTRMVEGAKLAVGAEHISKALSELYEEIKARSEDPKEIYGIETGFKTYDYATGGLQRGELTLLSGKPGLGKSIIAIQMAMQMAIKSPGAIYEMEMGRIQTVRRSVSTESEVETRKLRNGSVQASDWEKIMNAMQHFEKLPVYISDYTGWTTASMRADLARLKAMHKIEWFVVDYLYLLQDRYGKDDHERLAFVSKSLKNICKDLDLAGLVIHSMTKADMESHSPGLAGMRGSGQIAYDADVIVYLLEHETMKNLVKLHFVKFREDVPDRFIELKKVDGFPAFEDVNGKTYRMPYKD